MAIFGTNALIRLKTVLLTGGAGVVIGIGTAGFAMHHRAGHTHIQTREIAIASQAKQDDFPVVVMGDSIVELADLPTMCGKRVLNAGLAGGKLADIEAFAPTLLAGTRPKLIVIAAGVNDANADKPTEPEAFAAIYRRLITEAKATGAVVVLANIEPVSSIKFQSARLFDQSRIVALNREFAGLGMPTIDLFHAMMGNWNVLPDAESDDGVHPNAMGYRPWKVSIAGACRYIPA